MKTIVLEDDVVDALVNVIEDLLGVESYIGSNHATELNNVYEQLTGMKYNDATSTDMDDVFLMNSGDEVLEGEAETDG